MKKKGNETFRIGSRVIAGTVFGILLVGGAGGWAATAQLAGAVIAQGQVAVDQQIKAIQHHDGGIISAILIREGDHVEAGQILMRLDDTQTRAELSIIEAQMLELTVRRARLLAERDLLDRIEFPSALTLVKDDVQSLVTGEKRLFEGNLTNRESRKQQLELVLVQVTEEIKGLEAQLTAKQDEIKLVDEQRAKLEHLVSKKLLENTPLYSVKREVTRLEGERGEIEASIARARTKMNEIRLQILAVDETARTEAQRELTTVNTKLSELQDRHMAISDRLSRTDIRSPIDGTVHELNIHTIGGVITPAEVLATIVPVDARLKVEVMLPPTSIDQVAVGSSARIRLPALNQRTTPELAARVSHVSPATSRDPASGHYFYKGEVELSAGEIEKLGASKLIPGMPVEVFVTTSERTALSYFVKPITDQLSKAMRER